MMHILAVSIGRYSQQKAQFTEGDSYGFWLNIEGWVEVALQL
jgi:hypothetical protein